MPRRRVHLVAFLGLLLMFAGLVLTFSLPTLDRGIQVAMQALFFVGLGITLWALFEARRGRGATGK